MRQAQPARDAVVEVGGRRRGPARPPSGRGDGLTDEACAAGQVRPDRFGGSFDHPSMLREPPTDSADVVAGRRTDVSLDAP
jgi:hypothetical protein